jgi:hypothetical protein
MKNEIKERMLLKRNNTAVGSPEYLTYTEILLELDGVSLHKEEDSVCDGCA